MAIGFKTGKAALILALNPKSAFSVRSATDTIPLPKARDLARLLPTQQPSGFDGFARSPSGNPEKMNADGSSYRLRDEQ
jgi:hypothetical protein